MTKEKSGIVLGLILSFIIFPGIFLYVFSPILTRPLILKYGQETPGFIDNKFETHGRGHDFGVEVIFTADGEEYRHSYWIHPVDYTRIHPREAVLLKYLPGRPALFAIETYPQYSQSASFCFVLFFALPAFMAIYLAFGKKISQMLEQLSLCLKVSTRVAEWSLAILCVLTALLLIAGVEKIISPY